MRRRIRHYIKLNHNTELPTAAIWVDTETKPHTRADGSQEHRLWFGWSCYSRRRTGDQWLAPQWKRFTSAKQFWSWVLLRLLPKQRLYIFMHNTNFDLPVLKAFSLPKQMGFELTRAVIDAPPTIIHLKHQTSTVVVLDTLNFWRVPLKELGDSIGYKKLDMPAPDAPRDKWDAYGRQDVEIIYQACMRWWQFIRTNDLGGFAPTLAGQSLRTWRHRFMRHRVLIDNNERATDLARRAYLGGRNEVFRHGVIKRRVYYIDINSMYPSVMRGRPYPTELVGFDNRVPERTFLKYHKTHCTIGEVRLKTEEPVYPKVIDNRLCFPVGTFWTVLAGPELEYAFRHGQILDWKAVAVYKQAEIFTEFIDFFYNERLAAKAVGNSVLAFFLKILMNSLYGKFGQRGFVWEEMGTADDEGSKAWVEYDVHTGRIKRCRQLAGLLQVKSEDGEASESMPAIAAYVTSNARMALHHLIQHVGVQNTLYCDTDGLFCTSAGYKRVSGILSDKQLGAPKLEGSAPFISIRGLKDYDFGGKVRIKGVRKHAQWLSDSEVRQDQWSGLAGQLRRGDLDNAVTKSITKKLSRRYTKGVFETDGTVAPIRLSEGKSQTG